MSFDQKYTIYFLCSLIPEGPLALQEINSVRSLQEINLYIPSQNSWYLLFNQKMIWISRISYWWITSGCSDNFRFLRKASGLSELLGLAYLISDRCSVNHIGNVFPAKTISFWFRVQLGNSIKLVLKGLLDICKYHNYFWRIQMSKSREALAKIKQQQP